MEQNTGFYVLSLNRKNAYYIAIINENYSSDKYIADLLEIKFQEYESLLYSYGAHWEVDVGYLFSDESKALSFADYLNNKYLVMLKLTGKI